MLQVDNSKTLVAQLLSETEPGFKRPTDKFFEEGNQFLESFVKQAVVPNEGIECCVPTCNDAFDEVYEYRSHYINAHRYVCQQCKKSLPSAHLLDIHISEQHDSFFAVKASKEPMYVCLLETCKDKFSTPRERRKHCVKEHKFPVNFRFERCHISPKRKPINKAEEVTSTETESSEMDTEDTGESSGDKKVESGDKKGESGGEKGLKHFSFGHQKVKTFDSSPAAKKSKLKRTEKASPSKERDSVLEDPKTTAELKESLPKPKESKSP